MEFPPDAGRADEETPRNGQTYPQRVKSGEQHAFWKIGLRTTVIILDIIAIGAAAWTLANALTFRVNPYIGIFAGPEVSPWTIGVCGASFIFCLIMLLVLLLRKPPTPAHPGVAVAFDLIFWLAFIVTALFTTAGIISIASFGYSYNGDGTLYDPSSPSDYNGEYYLAPNNTWVYNVTYVSPYYSSGSGSGDSSSGSSSGSSNTVSTNYGDYFYNYTRHDWQQNTTKPALASVDRDCSSAGFRTCTEQDAYINHLWRSQPQRLGTEIVSGVAQWLLVLLHFILFVWACVDTHRYNRGIKQAKVNAVADRVIRDMQSRGLITVNSPGTAAEGQPLMAQQGNASAVNLGSLASSSAQR